MWCRSGKRNKLRRMRGGASASSRIYAVCAMLPISIRSALASREWWAHRSPAPRASSTQRRWRRRRRWSGRMRIWTSGSSHHLILFRETQWLTLASLRARTELISLLTWEHWQLISDQHTPLLHMFVYITHSLIFWDEFRKWWSIGKRKVERQKELCKTTKYTQLVLSHWHSYIIRQSHIIRTYITNYKL